jgi:hypothetical protein
VSKGISSPSTIYGPPRSTRSAEGKRVRPQKISAGNLCRKSVPRISAAADDRRARPVPRLRHGQLVVVRLLGVAQADDVLAQLEEQ